MSQNLLYNDKPPKAASNRISWHKGAHYVGHTDGQQLLIGINPVVILTGWEEKENPSEMQRPNNSFICLYF